MKQVRKVLMFIDCIGYGGAQNQFVTLALLLREAGYEVTILVVYDEYDFYQSALDGIKIVCDRSAKSPLRRLWRLPRLIKRLHPDVVIAYLDSQCVIACLARMLFNHRLIVSERNTTQVLRLKDRVKFWLYRFADYIVPNSFSQGEFILRHYPRYRNKLRVITNAIDERRFYPAESRSTNPRARIISVGRQTHQKNYLTMVDTIAILRRRDVEASFDWYAGTDDPDYAALVGKRIADYGLDEIITIHEPTIDIGDEYRHSDFFWLASVYEGFPNVLCEAMMCGLPVVCSNVCDNPKIVEEGVNGYLCDPLNAEEMAAKIEYLLSTSPSDLQRMSNNNVEKVRSLCSPSAFIQKYIDLINK